MRIFVRSALMLAVLLVSACASTPKYTMLVPSRSTIPQLELLSRQTDMTVDVITVKREIGRIQLDGSGGSALTGFDIDAAPPPGGRNPAVRIPFDDLALIYYPTRGLRNQETYPALPPVGVAEQALNCGDLAVELGRTEAIRWYARLQGGKPFTERDAATQHDKNAAIFATKVVAAFLIIGSIPYGGGGSFISPSIAEPNPVSVEAYRWAVTAADRRELGLLELKRDRRCAARETGTEGGTDLAIRERIADSRRDLAAKQITDREQMDRQTQLLDLLYPVPPTLPLATAAASRAEASAFNRVNYDVEWRANTDGEQHPSATLNKMPLSGHITFTDEGLIFVGRPIFGRREDKTVSIPFTDLTDAAVCQYGAWRGVVITHQDGHKDTFSFVRGKSVFDPTATQEVRDLLKSRIQPSSP
jgi:hypothetical protein